MKVVAITKTNCPRCEKAKALIGDDLRVTWLTASDKRALKYFNKHDIGDKAAPVFIIDDETVEISMLRLKRKLDSESRDR